MDVDVIKVSILWDNMRYGWHEMLQRLKDDLNFKPVIALPGNPTVGWIPRKYLEEPLYGFVMNRGDIIALNWDYAYLNNDPSLFPSHRPYGRHAHNPTIRTVSIDHESESRATRPPSGVQVQRSHFDPEASVLQSVDS